MMSSPPSQFNYPLPKVSITASQVGTRINVSIWGSFQQDIWVELNNESPYILSIFSAQGILLNSLQPQIIDIVQIPSGDSLFIIVPSLLIPQASPSSEVDINVYPFGKPEGLYPYPLVRQSSAISGAITFGYEANTFYPTSTAPVMCLFNPSNSTKIATFYAIRTLSGVTSAPSIFYCAQDQNYTDPVTPVSRVSSGQPASVLHCTAQTSLAVTGSTTRIEATGSAGNVVANQAWDFISSSQDNLKINPGTGLLIEQSSGSTTNVFINKWTEQ